MVSLIGISANQMLAQNTNKTLLQTEQMAAKLGLNEQQKLALDKELKAAQTERKASMEKMRALREEMKRDAFVERQAKEERLKEILTEEQYTKLKEASKNGQRSRIQDQRNEGEIRGRANRNESRFSPQNNRRNIGRRMIIKKRVAEMKERAKEKNEPKKDGGN
ncbi:hypothetical protein EV198_1780 [Roseivirga ehrenbergii]|nr:hypothetical protein EV198_1780 [Roseivirga ehrenbergii]